MASDGWRFLLRNAVIARVSRPSHETDASSNVRPRGSRAGLAPEGPAVGVLDRHVPIGGDIPEPGALCALTIWLTIEAGAQNRRYALLEVSVRESCGARVLHLIVGRDIPPSGYPRCAVRPRSRTGCVIIGM